MSLHLFFVQHFHLSFFQVFSCTFGNISTFFAIVLFSDNVLGFFFFDNSVVEVSASKFRTNSKFVMLSLRLSFFKSLKFLYPLVVKPDHAFVISYVRIAYSKLFLLHAPPTHLLIPYEPQHI